MTPALKHSELELLLLMMDGKRFTKIASELKVPQHRVRRIAFNIYNKLGASNRVEAVMFAYDKGLIDPFQFWGS